MINFPTDFHLGKSLKSNTTYTSRRLLEQKLYDLAYEVSTEECDDSVFCGDLFHNYSNNEMIIAQGYAICSKLDYVMAGNHDLKNQDGVKGSLQLIKEMLDHQDSNSEVILNEIGTGGFISTYTKDALVFMVPHHSDQEIFEVTLQSAIEYADRMKKDQQAILCLHCNYNTPWDKNETTLTLTEDDVEVLLESFDYVLIGHEHNSNTYHKGRLIMLGNHHPTGFSDIADKYLWSFNNGKMSKRLLWSMDKHYLELTAFDEVPDELNKDDMQFIRIVGKIESEELPLFSKWAFDLWKVFPKAYAIKNSVEVSQVEITQRIDADELESLPETIRKELKGTKLEKIYIELLEEVNV